MILQHLQYFPWTFKILFSKTLEEHADKRNASMKFAKVRFLRLVYATTFVTRLVIINSHISSGHSVELGAEHALPAFYVYVGRKIEK